MDDADLLDPFERLLADAAPIGALRSIEAGASVDQLWTALETSGFLDVLVPASAGGAHPVQVSELSTSAPRLGCNRPPKEIVIPPR